MHVGLVELGWSSERQRELEALGSHLVPARVSSVDRSHVGLAGASLASVHISKRHLPPVTGDWVALDGERIHAVLARSSKLARRSPKGGEQIACANVDKVLIVTAIGPDFSARRVERFIALTYEGGAQPIVVINKCDLGDAPPLAVGAPVVAVSATREDGLAALMPHLVPCETIVLVGSSGVGKSSLTNRLLGAEQQPIQATRARDDKGRHTTVRRELFRTPLGVLVIDTPGVREVGMIALDEGLDLAFADIASFAGECRFRDCRHRQEPGCAVREAIDRGELDPQRLDSYLALDREAGDEKRKAKIGAKAYRAWKKLNER